MSKRTAEKAIEIAANEAKKQYDKTLMVYFIGGEPLMAFTAMQEMTFYIKNKCEENSLQCLFSTTINGTLITEEVVDFFSQNDFDIKLSLDGGEEVHDRNRKDYTGHGSFQSIADNLPFLKSYEENTGKKVTYAQVVTMNNCRSWIRSFQFLLDFGCLKIESGIDHYCTWKEEDLIALKQQLIGVFELYKAHIQNTKKWFYWNMFEQYLETYLLHCEFYACKAGLNSVYVTTDGKIYTCTEHPEFSIGNVETGLDVPRIREIVYVEDVVNEKCRECEYIKSCKARGCQTSNYEINKNIYQPVDVSCFITKTMYELIEKNFTKEQLNKMREEFGRERHEANN